MAFTTGAFPHNIENLLGGAVAIYYAEADGADAVAVPTNIASVRSMTGTGAPVTGWTRIGATKDAFSSSRGFAEQGYEIQNVPGFVVSEITSITRAISVSMAEFRPDLLGIVEGTTAAVEDFAAATGIGAQKIIKYGAISSPKSYRWAYIARRPREAGIVYEGAGDTVGRGRMFMGCMYRGKIGAEDVSLEQAKGSLSARSVSFSGFPEPGQPEGQEYGMWADEQAGTIA